MEFKRTQYLNKDSNNKIRETDYSKLTHNARIFKRNIKILQNYNISNIT